MGEQVRTHLGIDAELCGSPVSLAPGRAVVELATTPAMGADAQGLVHGGFVLGAADYAAMLAINDPTVVLGAANLRFTAPVRVGDVVRATAVRTSHKGRKHTVEVEAMVGETAVLTGTLTTFVLDHHVLDDLPS